MCNWVLLSDKQNSNQRICGNPGHPYCEEHQREIDVMEHAYKGWDEIFAALLRARMPGNGTTSDGAKRSG